MMRYLLATLALVGFFASDGRAGPILTVRGAGDLGHSVGADDAAAVVFTLSQSFFDVSITADLTPVGDIFGAAFLMSNIGPVATFGDVVASVDFSDITFNGASTLLFSGLTLGPGDYYVVIGNETGLVIWNGSSTPIVTASDGIMHGVDFFSDAAAPFPPFSDFTVLFDRSAHYTVSAVPEPASFTLLALGAVGLALGRRRR